MNSKLYLTEASQYPAEIDAFCELVHKEYASSFLEIGSKFGGMLWRVSQELNPGSRIVSIDLPNGTIKWAKSKPSLEGCIANLNKLGHDARVIWGDSTDPYVFSQVQDSGPFDVVFIDANHTLPYLRQDWHNYGWLGKMVGFHDIAWKRDPGEFDYSRIDAPAFWDEIKDGYHHVEIKLDPTGRDNGIGVLWR